MKRKPRPHCWHNVDATTGRVLWFTSGPGAIRCCECGVRAQRRFEEVTCRAEGHGPFAEVKSSFLVVVGADEICPGAER